MLKKSLSQHLLKDKNLLEKMVRLSGVGMEDVVVEIGPGQGDLTSAIAHAAGSVYAVEVDRSFAPKLAELRSRCPHVQVVFADFLSVNLVDFARERKITVMGNIPYKITADILFRLLAEKRFIVAAYLTMQKEVADRLAGRPCNRSYGALSVVFQLYAEVKVLLTLKPSLFIPPPKVDSAYVAIRFKPDVTVDDELIGFIKTCFRYKRKYLSHSLKERYETGKIAALYETFGFPPTVRAEEIEPERFLRMHGFLRAHR